MSTNTGASTIKMLLKTAPTPYALYALRQLDANHKLDSYLYFHILGYQAYDSSIHTSEKALYQDDELLVRFLIENDLWTLKTKQALKLSFMKGSYNVCKYLLQVFNIPLTQIEDVFSDYPNTWWKDYYSDQDSDDEDFDPGSYSRMHYKPFTNEFILYLIQNYTPLESSVMTIGYWITDYTRNQKLLKKVLDKGWITWNMLYFCKIRREPTLELVKEILEYNGANVNYGIQTACTVKDISMDIILYLVERGASVSHVSCIGWAVYHKHIPLVKFLIEQGIAIATAMKFAEIYKTPTVIQFLKSVQSKHPPNLEEI